MQVLLSTYRTNTLTYIILAMPLLRSKFGKSVVRKSWNDRRFEINDVLQKLLDLSFSPCRTTKCLKYETGDINIFCVRL